MSVYAVHESIQNPAGLNPVRHLFFALDVAQNVLFALNVLVADLLFLWRCYVIWGNQRSVVFLPGLSVAATAAVSVGYCVTLRGSAGPVSRLDHTSAVDPRIPFILGVFTNLVLMALTAGRIWWIRQQARMVCGRENIFERRYGMALTLILESGALYCLCAILVAIFKSPNASLVASAIFDAVGNQGVNILPTLIVVRIGLGHNIQDTIQEFARAPHWQTAWPK
ncbi:hypothetical protein B0H19DRAFT_77632 [Mycena capillaripes]|nr:hypothetical protein B0H19DRAFT_77632 [Mycena capillaripes]